MEVVGARPDADTEDNDVVFVEEVAGDQSGAGGRAARGGRKSGERSYSWREMRASGTVPQHLWEAGQIGNQYRNIGSDPYQERRTKPEGAFGPPRKPRISIPRLEGHVELPVRYRHPNSWGRACGFCGATNHVSPKCGGRLEMIRKHGASCVGWPETCVYPYCYSKKGHRIAACPALHAFCSRCLRRGHLPGTCDQLPTVGDHIRAENYVLYCIYGRYTRNYLNRFELDWSYLGPKMQEADLVEVGVGDHRGLMAWGPAQIQEFQEATEAKKHSMITKEIFR